MLAEAEEIGDLERELRSFKQLLESSIRSEEAVSGQLATAERELALATRQCQLLTAENEQLSAVLHQKLELISVFVAEFQKNLQDAFNFQKSKQELFRSLKDMNEKSLRHEREARRLQAALVEREEEAAGLKAALEKAESGLTKEVDEIQRQFVEFVQNSVEKDLRRKVEALEKALAEQERKLAETHQRLNQKSVELDLLRVDYKVLLNPKTETAKLRVNSPARTNRRSAPGEEGSSQQLIDRLQNKEREKRRKTPKKKQKGDGFYDYF